MATKNVKKLAIATSDIGGLKSSRYEKIQVSYGAIASSAYSLGDTIAFSEVPALDIIKATVVAHSTNPAVLDVYPASSKSNTFNLNIPGASAPVDLSYIIEYVRGASSSGNQKISVTVGSSALSALSTSQISALDSEVQIGSL